MKNSIGTTLFSLLTISLFAAPHQAFNTETGLKASAPSLCPASIKRGLASVQKSKKTKKPSLRKETRTQPTPTRDIATFSDENESSIGTLTVNATKENLLDFAPTY